MLMLENGNSSEKQRKLRLVERGVTPSTADLEVRMV